MVLQVRLVQQAQLAMTEYSQLLKRQRQLEQKLVTLGLIRQLQHFIFTTMVFG
jgi:hypothetical protein